MPQNPILFDDGYTIVFNNSSNNAGLLQHTVIYLLDGNDSVVATNDFAPEVYGGRGNDTIDYWVGSLGHGNFYGGAGNDHLGGGKLEDNLYGDDGVDTILGRQGNDIIEGGQGNDFLYGGYDYTPSNSGIDNIYGGSGLDTIFGGDDQDFLYGGGGADSIFGGHEDDEVDGNSGDDIVTGGDGNDKVYGGSGKDLLTGGNDRDRLWGGGEADTFDFNAAGESAVGANRDIIKDFDHDEADLIDLKGIDAKSGPAGDQAFTFIGDTSFNNKAGELRFHNGVLSGDTNGDGSADFQIKVNGINSLSANDLVL